MKWTVIGRGSNLLVLDEGIRGVVIKLGVGLDHLELEGEQVTVGGGYSVVRLATSLSKKACPVWNLLPVFQDQSVEQFT